jgi:Arc/MetJ-type ribon-helix-helix transcriptional regulator
VTGKQRLSASVDAELLETAQSAVRAGRAESLSAWVNDALRLKADHERRMEALDVFLAAYEAEHGVITDEEMDQAVRRARVTALDCTSGRSAGASARRARRDRRSQLVVNR